MHKMNEFNLPPRLGHHAFPPPTPRWVNSGNSPGFQIVNNSCYNFYKGNRVRFRIFIPSTVFCLKDAKSAYFHYICYINIMHAYLCIFYYIYLFIINENIAGLLHLVQLPSLAG